MLPRFRCGFLAVTSSIDVKVEAMGAVASTKGASRPRACMSLTKEMREMRPECSKTRRVA